MATTPRSDRRPTERVSAELLDRLPPHSPEAEKAVLGSLLLDPELCDEVALVLRQDDFYADAHQVLYGQLMAMHAEDRRVDELLLAEELRRSGALETIGGVAYLVEIAQSAPTAAHAIEYAKLVQNHATLRSLIHASTEILREAYDPTLEPRELLSRAEEVVFAIKDQRGSTNITSIERVLYDVFDRIDARKQQDRHVGVPTGFIDLDQMTGGLQNSELIILAARPSMGKTALAANIAEYAAVKQGMPTLFFSLEMSSLELGERLLCSRAEVDSFDVRRGFIRSADQKRLADTANEISKAPLYIDDSPARNMTEISAAARRMRRRDGLSLVVIDYLQLIDPDNARDPRQEQVARIARRLKGMARELKIPVLCLAQLNRQAEATKDNRPRLSHLRESGAIEQDADVVMFVHREEYYHTQEEIEQLGLAGKAEIILSKQRNGPTGDVKLNWQAQYTRFKDLESRHSADEEYAFKDSFD